MASIANHASDRSLDAALRAADEAGGAYEIKAYRPSSTAASAAWVDADKYVASVRKRFLCETLVVASLCLVPLLMSAAYAYGWYVGNGGLVVAVTFGALALVLFTASYFEGYGATLRSRSDVKTQGFARDDLINAVVRTAGTHGLSARRR